MINKELDGIMTEYVEKANKYCRNYEATTLEKGYSTFSHTMEIVFENFENGLWKLKSDTEGLLYIAHDRFCNRVANNEIVACINLVNEECERVHKDLNILHNYYLHRYASNIAKGLAKQWSEKADDCAGEIFRQHVKSILKVAKEEGACDDD